MFDDVSPMSTRTTNAPKHSLWLPLSAMTFVLVLRALSHQGWIADSWANFSPIMALAFAGTMMMPRQLAWWTWPVALCGVDALLLSQSAYPVSWSMNAIMYAMYAVVAFLALKLRHRRNAWQVLGGTLACSVMFYVITNALCWLGSPLYPQNLSGLWQSLTLGLPGHPSSLLFFRNALMADLCGALIILAIANTEAALRGIESFSFSSKKLA